MNIIAVNNKTLEKHHPLANLLCNTDKPVGNFLGMDIYSVDGIPEDAMFIIQEPLEIIEFTSQNKKTIPMKVFIDDEFRENYLKMANYEVEYDN